MIVTTYTCDRCGHDQTTDEQMWQIGIWLNHFGGRYGPSREPSNIQLWCRDCIESLGLLPQAGGAKDAPPPPDPPPTLEDMIREIARQEMAPGG